MSQTQSTRVDYARSHYPLRKDLVDAHRAIVDHVKNAGTWWTGVDRVAIATEARAARDCALCAEKKAAVSPFSIDGNHDVSQAGSARLATEVIDVIHRIVTDPGRLTRSGYERLRVQGVLDDVRYVELVSVTVLMNALDVFALAIGTDWIPLPEAVAGEPSRVRPATARVDGAWVPQIPPGPDGGEEYAALYGGQEFVPQIARALSLVPAEVEMLNRVSRVHYMDISHVGDPRYAEPDRALDRPQMELVAARVSAINECFY